jgi:TolA-binding protein
VVAIAAVGAGIGAYFAGGRSNGPAQQSAAAPTGAAATSTPGAAPAVTQPSATTAAPAGAPPTDAAPAKTAAKDAATDKPGAPAGSRVAASKPAGAVPTPVSKDSEAAQRLDVAKAKLANNLNDQALADLRQIILDYPQSASAAEAAFLSADIHEKSGRPDDAMAAFVEFESRFARDRRAAESKLRRAQILARRQQPATILQARELMNDVARDYPRTPSAQYALQLKLKLETERKNLREIDPVLKVQVPAVMVTLRQIIEQFPEAPQSMAARNRLALMLEDMDRYQESVAVLEDLALRAGETAPDLWFRIGEMYERRLRNPQKARDSYAKVPQASSRYAEAQRRLKRK